MDAGTSRMHIVLMKIEDPKSRLWIDCSSDSPHQVALSPIASSKVREVLSDIINLLVCVKKPSAAGICTSFSMDLPRNKKTLTWHIQKWNYFILAKYAYALDRASSRKQEVKISKIDMSLYRPLWVNPPTIKNMQIIRCNCSSTCLPEILDISVLEQQHPRSFSNYFRFGIKTLLNLLSLAICQDSLDAPKRVWRDIGSTQIWHTGFCLLFDFRWWFMARMSQGHSREFNSLFWWTWQIDSRSRNQRLCDWERQVYSVRSYELQLHQSVWHAGPANQTRDMSRKYSVRHTARIRHHRCKHTALIWGITWSELEDGVVNR